MRKPKKFSEQWKRKLSKRAESLDRRKYASEEWFKMMWYKDGMCTTTDRKKIMHLGLFADRFNHAYAYYIPDVINLGYRYIIEIDGEMHASDAAVRKDARRTKFFNSQGFKVYRIQAFNLVEYAEALEKVRKLRKDFKPSAGRIALDGSVPRAISAPPHLSPKPLTEDSARSKLIDEMLSPTVKVPEIQDKPKVVVLRRPPSYHSA